MAAAVYISDKAVVELVPYAARRTALRLDVGPFVLLYLGVYLGIWNLDPTDGWEQVVVLVLLPGVLVCHLLMFLSTQWSIRFMCLVSQRRVASIDLAKVCRPKSWYNRLNGGCGRMRPGNTHAPILQWCVPLISQPLSGL